MHAQVSGRIDAGTEAEGIPVKFLTTPRTVLDGNGRWVRAGVALETHRLRVSRILRAGTGVAPASHSVRCGRRTNPQADFKRPLAQLCLVLVAFQFEGANQRGGATQLIERQQPQRVAHENADARRVNSRMPHTAQDHRESS